MIYYCDDQNDVDDATTSERNAEDSGTKEMTSTRWKKTRAKASSESNNKSATTFFFVEQDGVVVFLFNFLSLSLISCDVRV